MKKCNLPYIDKELEEKLRELVKGDLISEGRTSIDYKGMSDDIFYKVFRYKYQKEIEDFLVEEIEEEEYSQQMERIQKLETELQAIKGRESYHKGHLFEYFFYKHDGIMKIKQENGIFKVNIALLTSDRGKNLTGEDSL